MTDLERDKAALKLLKLASQLTTFGLTDDLIQNAIEQLKREIKNEY